MIYKIFKHALRGLGDLYKDIGQYNKAEPFYQEMISILEHLQGKENADYANNLNKLAELYWRASRYKEAESIQLEVVSIFEKVSGKESREYLGKVFQLAIIYSNMQEFEKAESLFLETLSIQERVLGKESLQVAATLNSLGALNMDMDNVDKAEEYFLKSKNINEKLLGKKNWEVALSLENLGSLYFEECAYEKAEPLLLESISIIDSLFGKLHAKYYNALNRICRFYLETGDYENAEKYHNEKLLISQQVFGKEDLIYSKALADIGTLYFEMDNIKKSFYYYEQSLEIKKKFIDKDPAGYAVALGNISVLYAQLGEYEKAEALALESLTIKKRTLAKEDENDGQAQNTLGNIYKEMGESKKSEQMFLESINLREKQFTKNHPQYALGINNLANLYAKMGENSKAESLFVECKSIRERVLGKEHPHYAKTVHQLAKFYSSIGSFEKATELYHELSILNYKLLYRTLRHLSTNEIEEYLQRFLIRQSEVLEFVRTKYSNSVEILHSCYDNSLFYKNFLLNAGNAIKHQALTNPVTSEQFSRLKSYGRRLSSEYTKPTSERDSLRVAELEEKANNLEKELARTVAGFEESERQITSKEVLDNLRNTETAIEFVHHQIFDPKPSDSVYYAALVLLPHDTTPHYIPLFEEKQLTTLLAKTESRAEASSALYAARSGELLDAAPAYGTELYNLIWKPLDSLLQKHGIKTVYFSPSGLLHRVAFAALPVNSKKNLTDRYALHQLGSTRSLVVKTPEPVAKDYSAAVFGGVQYERNTTLPADSTLAEITDNRLWNLMERPRSSGDAGFDYLPGTQQEANRLQQLLPQSRVRVQTHTGAQATEEALKTLGRDTVKSPDILHIATHGFFFPDPEKRKEQRFGEENVFKWNENPLFRSGLAFAGANAAWSGQPTPGHIEDGIATAYEISHLNLSNTKLAVLSACQTGLGDIKGSEGVYGLQRAFKMAGVDYLLVSLWQVPDQETAEFMDVFYKTWLGGKTIHEAFAKAQKKMRKKYKEVYKWGAWVLVE